MGKNKKLLLLTHNQFGYQADFFNYSKYLSNSYQIIYLCFDEALQKVQLKNVKIIYLDKPKINIFKNIIILTTLLKIIKINKIRVAIFKYIPGIFLISLLSFNN